MMWIRVGALMMATGIVLGAFGTHGLQDSLDAAKMQMFQTAVFYHLLHALGLLIVGMMSLQTPSRSRLFPTGCFLTAGILLFSGSLYASAIGGLASPGLITPLGGVCLVVGWIFLVFSF